MAEQTGEIFIRKLVEDDLAKVIYIESLVHGKENKPAWPFSFESYWEIYRPNLNLVAELDGQVIGFIVGKILKNKNLNSIIKRIHSGELDSKHEWFGWIDMICTHPDYRQKGIARKLMQAFYEECIRRKALVKTVLYRSDERYQRLLMNMGFRESNPVIYEKI